MSKVEAPTWTGATARCANCGRQVPLRGMVFVQGPTCQRLECADMDACRFYAAWQAPQIETVQ